MGSTASASPPPPQQVGSQQLALPPVLAAWAARPYFSLTTFRRSWSFMASPFASTRLTGKVSKGRRDSSSRRRIPGASERLGEPGDAGPDVLADLADPLDRL